HQARSHRLQGRAGQVGGSRRRGAHQRRAPARRAQDRRAGHVIAHAARSRRNATQFAEERTMPLFSVLLSDSARLESAAAGGPSVKKRPPDDEPDAVRRIQRALVELGFPLPKSFPDGPAAEPDGLFGPETFNAVYGFQKRE